MTDGPVHVRYRHPELMEAWQVTADNLDEVARWCGGTAFDMDGRHEVMTPWQEERSHQDFAEIGDWVIKRGSDSTVVLPDDAFRRHYEPADPEPRPATEVRSFATTEGHYRLTRRTYGGRP